MPHGSREQEDQRSPSASPLRPALHLGYVEERRSELDEAEAASQARSCGCSHTATALHAAAAFARAASILATSAHTPQLASIA